MLQGAVQVRATIGVVTKIKVIVLAHKNMQDIIQDTGPEQKMLIHQRAQKVAVPVAAELRVQIGWQAVAAGHICIQPRVQELAVKLMENSPSVV